MTIAEKLIRSRQFLKINRFNALIVPLTDPHFNEYIQERYKSVEWLSGFGGSAATLLVSSHSAFLWSDSRYFIEGERQLKGSTIQFMRSGAPGVPSLMEWLSENLREGGRVAIDSSLISVVDYREWSGELAPIELILCNDPFDYIWQGRSALFHSQAYTMPLELAGERAASKIERLWKEVEGRHSLGSGTLFYLLSACDEIAWLCNIRGEDLPYNPLLYSYMLLEKGGESTLFLSQESVTTHLLSHLEESSIKVEEYVTVEEKIASLPANVTVIAPLRRTSMKLYSAAAKGGRRVIDDTKIIVSHMKAQKNSVEIEGFRLAMVKDGVAWVRVLIELERRVKKGEEPIYESEVASLFFQKRSLDREYRSESFAPIVAFGANGAMPHYSFDNGAPNAIGERGFLLIDTGAQYMHGTTDTTRTLYMGSPTRKEILDYTMVLRGMINLSSAIFPQGSRGASLDILARGEVYKRGVAYLHGTGHGVGHHLCVHEGPQSIRREENPTPLQEGMVLSNEPALYREGEYGIRVENLLHCTSWEGEEHSTFLNFETLTLVPIELKCVDFGLLGKERIEWIDHYHQKVYNGLSPYLEEIEKQWLALKCAPVATLDRD